VLSGSEAKDPVKEKEAQKQRAKAERKQRREQGEQLLFHADVDGTYRAMFRLRRGSLSRTNSFSKDGVCLTRRLMQTYTHCGTTGQAEHARVSTRAEMGESLTKRGSES